jgi:dephospho-CoA kinase
MIVVGLVGRVGAGKSTVARRFAEHGATVVDADAIAHDALTAPEVIAAVVDRFGAGVLAGDGRVDRSALARLVFGETPAHAAALTALEAIVHPRVRRRVEAILDDERALDRDGDGGRVVVLDVPLLVQAGWDDLCTRLVLVECEEPVRRARLAARGWSVGQIAARDRAWERGYRPPAAGRATCRVDASRDPAYTAAQVDEAWRAMRSN